MAQKRLVGWGILVLLTFLAPACGGGGGGKKKKVPPTPGVVAMVASAAAVNEGTTGTQTVPILVSRTGGNGVVTVQFTTTDGAPGATAGADYTTNTGTLTWTATDFADKTITVAIADQDGLVEGDETFTVTLSSPSGATLGATTVTTVTIGDLDAPADGVFEFSQAIYTIVEDGAVTVPVTITVNRTGGTTGDTTVDCVVAAGSATAGADYTVPPIAGTVTLTFLDGDSQETFTIDILADAADALGTETITLTLQNPTPVPGPEISPTAGTAVVNIIDRQAAGTIQFSSPTYTISETGVTATLTVQRVDGAGGALSASVTLGGGTTTAVAGTNYTDPGAINLNWGDGDITDQTFTIDVLDNLIVDGNRLLEMLLASAATITGTNPAVLTITDDEAGTFVFSASDYPITEGDAGSSIVTITVNRVNGSGGAASVEVLVSDGTATIADADYVAPVTNPVVLNFAAGETVKTFDITINGDATFEANETILLAMQNPTGSSLGAPSTATITITNDDAPPGGTISLSSNAYAAAEGTAVVTITVNRTGLTGQAASCNLRTANITAKGNGKKRDFVSKNVTVNFAIGETVQTVDITIVDDTTPESDETFRVQLSTPSAGSVIGTPAVATVTVSSNE